MSQDASQDEKTIYKTPPLEMILTVCMYIFQDPRLDESEEQNNDQSKLETDTSEEKETIVEKGDTDFKEIETEPKPEAVKYDSDFLIEGDLEEMMPNSDDYYDDYTAYTTPETTRLVQI